MQQAKSQAQSLSAAQSQAAQQVRSSAQSVVSGAGTQNQASQLSQLSHPSSEIGQEQQSASFLSSGTGFGATSMHSSFQKQSDNQKTIISSIKKANSSVQNQSVYISSNKNSSRGANDTSLTISQGNINPQNMNIQIRQSIMNKKLTSKIPAKNQQQVYNSQYYGQQQQKTPIFKAAEGRAAGPGLRNNSAQSKGGNMSAAQGGKLRINTSSAQTRPNQAHQPELAGATTAKVGRVNVLAAGSTNPYDQVAPGLHARQSAPINAIQINPNCTSSQYPALGLTSKSSMMELIDGQINQRFSRGGSSEAEMQPSGAQARTGLDHNGLLQPQSVGQQFHSTKNSTQQLKKD
jgi:hypothetical protein